jgi:hypothetical protein
MGFEVYLQCFGETERNAWRETIYGRSFQSTVASPNRITGA